MLKIKELDQNCNIINKNIEISKKKMEKEAKGENIEDDENKLIEKEKEQINKYEEDNKLLNEKEKNCKIMLREQDGIILKLKEDIKSIDNNAKKIEKKIKETQNKITLIQNKNKKKNWNKIEMV